MLKEFKDGFWTKDQPGLKHENQIGYKPYMLNLNDWLGINDVWKI